MQTWCMMSSYLLHDVHRTIFFEAHPELCIGNLLTRKEKHDAWARACHKY
jgi:hypothetical protein